MKQTFISHYKDKCKQQPCPFTFPNFDMSHRHEPYHGDVCRNEKIHGYNVGWTCPCGCVSTGNRAPWCEKDGEPCRVTGLFIDVIMILKTIFPLA